MKAKKHPYGWEECDYALECVGAMAETLYEALHYGHNGAKIYSGAAYGIFLLVGYIRQEIDMSHDTGASAECGAIRESEERPL